MWSSSRSACAKRPRNSNSSKRPRSGIESKLLRPATWPASARRAETMTFAVAGGGRVSGSFVARLPRLASQLGPVAAQSYRLASRIVNSIGAGHAVRRYEDLNDSALILICAPAQSVVPIVSALADALECRGKVFLLCEDGADSRQLTALKSKGAKVGSIQVMRGFEGR